jgi:hypothetical protein
MKPQKIMQLTVVWSSYAQVVFCSDCPHVVLCIWLPSSHLLFSCFCNEYQLIAPQNWSFKLAFHSSLVYIFAQQRLFLPLLHEGGGDPLNIQDNERSQGGGRYEVSFGVSWKLMRCTTT